jgi:TonB family protein
VNARLLAFTAALVAEAAMAAGPVAPAAAPATDGGAVSTHRVAPAYPAKAQKKGVDGCVVLSFLIDAEGRPTDVQVVDSQPKGVFDAATLKVFGEWRFEQPRRPGRYAQSAQFRLKDRAPVNTCMPLPSFAAMNPDAPPATRTIRVLETVMPDFRREGAAVDGGCVTVRFQIKYDGFVGEVQVLEARPESLAAPTVAALKQWHFQSFPPPDVYATQTFNFTPELVRLPETLIRASYADAAGSEVRAIGCGGKPAATAAPPVVTEDARP